MSVLKRALKVLPWLLLAVVLGYFGWNITLWGVEEINQGATGVATSSGYAPGSIWIFVGPFLILSAIGVVSKFFESLFGGSKK